ncbi:sodium- and chloride-dependent GABA transporter 1-like [Tachypleus tridentatus]|uniref:sodium- and chloride-dependent GABA transporter 1-like n=1 Tax=Tachypleus tridentatus TaxID=6853 RepID=UPI003FD09306
MELSTKVNRQKYLLVKIYPCVPLVMNKLILEERFRGFLKQVERSEEMISLTPRSSAVFGTSTENARIETWDLLRLCWTYVSPIFIFCIFLFAMIYYKDLEWQDYQYPKWSITVGWLLTVSSLSFIPIYMIYRIIITPGTFTQRVIDAFQPEKPGVNQAEHESLPINASYASV